MGILKRKHQPDKAETKKKARAEEKTAEESEEEKLEEEEEEEIEEASSAKSCKLTKKALSDHDTFIAEVMEGKPTFKQFEQLLHKADNNMVMRLWKHFETSRKSSNTDEEYKSITKGAGGVSKKKELLRGWVLDGGKTCKHFKETCQSFKMTQAETEEGEWLSKKQILDAIGQKS